MKLSTQSLVMEGVVTVVDYILIIGAIHNFISVSDLETYLMIRCAGATLVFGTISFVYYLLSTDIGWGFQLGLTMGNDFEEPQQDNLMVLASTIVSICYTGLLVSHGLTNGVLLYNTTQVLMIVSDLLAGKIYKQLSKT